MCPNVKPVPILRSAVRERGERGAAASRRWKTPSPGAEERRRAIRSASARLTDALPLLIAPASRGAAEDDDLRDVKRKPSRC